MAWEKHRLLSILQLEHVEGLQWPRVATRSGILKLHTQIWWLGWCSIMLQFSPTVLKLPKLVQHGQEQFLSWYSTGRSSLSAPLSHMPERWHLQLAHTVPQVVFWTFQGGNWNIMKIYSNQIITIDCSLDILMK